MRQENTFRSTFVGKCNENGLYALALETTVPGFPDVQIIDNNAVLLIETKCVKESELSHSLMTKFKPSQPVFYKEYLSNSNNDNLFGLIKVNRKKYILFEFNNSLVNKMYGLHFNEIKNNTAHYLECDNLEIVIEWLKIFLR